MKFEIRVRDPNNEDFMSKPIRKSDLLLRNFIRILVCHLTGAETIAYDQNGEEITITHHQNSFNIMAGQGNDSKGIVVGLSSESEEPTQYRLISKISHGSGQGQLWYGAMATSCEDQSLLVIGRPFTNRTLQDIEVKEVGLLAETSSGIILIERTVLVFTIKAGKTKIVEYLVSL